MGEPGTSVVVRHDAGAGTYEAVDGDPVLGSLVYRRTPERVLVTRTFTDPAARGRGIAAVVTR